MNGTKKPIEDRQILTLRGGKEHKVLQDKLLKWWGVPIGLLALPARIERGDVLQDVEAYSRGAYLDSYADFIYGS